MPIVSNSPHLVTCARPASPTCSLPCWEISLAIRSASYKEWLNEYSIERRARVSVRAEGTRARGHVSNSAHVLVGAKRIVGEPFHLYRAAGRRRRHSVRLPDRHDWSCDVGARPGAEGGRARRAEQLCCASDHGDRFYRRGVLQSRGAA